MDGKRRQYVAPSIGNAPSNKSAAAAAAEAAAISLMNLRRSAAALQQQQHSAESSTASPFSAPAQSAAASQTPGRLAGPLGRPVDTLDPSEARARAAAAAAALTNSTHPPTALARSTADWHSGEQTHREGEGRWSFALPRPDSFHTGSATATPAPTIASAAAAAAAAAYMRARYGGGGGAVMPPLANTVTAQPRAVHAFSSSSSPSSLPSSEEHAPTPPVAVQVSPQLFPRPTSTDAESGQRSTPMPPGKRPREEDSSDSNNTEETEEEEGEVKDPSEDNGSASGSVSSSADSIDARNHHRNEESQKEEEEEKKEKAKVSAETKAAEKATAPSATTPVGSTAKTSAVASPQQPPGKDAQQSKKQQPQQKSTSQGFLSRPTSAPQKTGPQGGTGGRPLPTPPAISKGREAEPRSSVLSASELKELVKRATSLSAAETTAARKGSDGVSLKEKGDEEEENEEEKAMLGKSSKGAKNAAHGVSVQEEEEKERKQQAGEVERIRAFVQQREVARMRRRAVAAAALPAAPADHVLQLLCDLPAAPRRAVYSRDDCPCQAKDGFTESFHNCVQRAMTRIVLQRDGRLHDVDATKEALATAPLAASSPYEQRVRRLLAGVEPEVRDVVAFAQHTVQLQQQQQDQGAPTAGPRTGTLSAKLLSASDAAAVVDVQLSPLRTFVEAKLKALRSSASSPDIPAETAAEPVTTHQHPIPPPPVPASGQLAERAASPTTESCSGPVTAPLIRTHQRFIDIVRAAAASRLERAEAAQQAEQRLATTAAAWRSSFTDTLRSQKASLEKMRGEDPRHNTVEPPTFDEGALQRLQRLFFPQDAPASGRGGAALTAAAEDVWSALPPQHQFASPPPPHQQQQRQHQQQQQQGHTKASRKQMAKERRRARLEMQEFQSYMSAAGLELPLPPNGFPLLPPYHQQN